MDTLNALYNESNKKTKTRTAIVNAAMRVALEEGFAAMTMPRVAAECGVTVRNLYRYYENTDWLVIDVMYDFYSLHQDKAEQLAPKAGDTGVRYVKRLLYNRFYNEYSVRDFPVRPGHSSYNSVRLMHEFNLFLLKMPKDSPVFLRYTQLYSKDVNALFKATLVKALAMGIQDGTVCINSDEIPFYIEFIMQSMAGIASIVMLKGHERASINPTLIEKNIALILFYLENARQL